MYSDLLLLLLEVHEVLTFDSLLYGRFDNVISDRILQHHKFVPSYEHSNFEMNMEWPCQWCAITRSSNSFFDPLPIMFTSHWEL